MKKDLHPTYVTTKVKCACGNEFEIKSTMESLYVESCNKCHAAYTGKTKAISAAGRVEQFNKKFGLK